MQTCHGSIPGEVEDTNRKLQVIELLFGQDEARY